MTAHTTIQSSRTAETVVDRNGAVSAGILTGSFHPFCLCGHYWSLGPIFSSRSLHPKIPFPAVRFRPTKGRLAVRKFGIPRAKNAI
jgi:hypothetical protein